MTFVKNNPIFNNIPLKNPAVLSRNTFDGNFLLVNGDTGTSLALNMSGKVIWDLIDGKRTEAEIIAQVSTNFQNVPDSVTEDVTSLISTLTDEGFIGYEINVEFLTKY